MGSPLFYLLGFLISSLSILKNKNNQLAILLVGLCILFLGEETSWMQRAFSYSVPAIEAINAQSEFNIHNLKIFGDSRLSDLLSGLDYIKLLKIFLNPQVLFQIGFGAYFVIIPVLLRISRFNIFMSSIGYQKTDTSFIYMILVVIVMSFFLALDCPPEVKENLAEVREMLYAYFIMMYLGLYLYSPESIRITPMPWSG